MKSDDLDPQQLAQLWQGKIKDEFAEATIIGTTAIALKLINRADTQQQAHDLATQYWLNRRTITA